MHQIWRGVSVVLILTACFAALVIHAVQRQSTALREAAVQMMAMPEWSPLQETIVRVDGDEPSLRPGMGGACQTGFDLPDIGNLPDLSEAEEEAAYSRYVYPSSPCS